MTDTNITGSDKNGKKTAAEITNDLFCLLFVIIFLVFCWGLFFVITNDPNGQVKKLIEDRAFFIIFSLLTTLYIPVSAIYFCKFRGKVRAEQINLTLECLNKKNLFDKIKNTYGYDACEMTITRLALPSFLAFLIGLSCLLFFFLGEDTGIVKKQNVFFGGMNIISINTDHKEVKKVKTPENNTNDCKSYDCKLIKYQKGAFLMYGMACLGAILWGIQNIRRRYVLFDINSNVYYSLSIRILLSGVIAVIFYHLSDAFTDGVLAILSNGNGAPKNAEPSSLMPVIAFFIGMFPQRGLIKLKEQVKIFSDENPYTIQLPLDTVPGITQDDIVRLKEIGVDNCYILAHRQFFPLLFLTPYDPLNLIDWILKSKLYSYFPEVINELRQNGINDISDIPGTSNSDDGLKDQLMEETQLTKYQLEHAFKSIEKDRQIKVLTDYRDKLKDPGNGLGVSDKNKREYVRELD